MKIIDKNERYIGKTFKYRNNLDYRITGFNANKTSYVLICLNSGSNTAISVNGFNDGLLNNLVKLL